jgi:hypothetical protein
MDPQGIGCLIMAAQFDILNTMFIGEAGVCRQRQVGGKPE